MVDETRSVELAIDNKRALKELAELRKSQEDLAKSAAKGDKAFDEAAKSINKLQKQERDLIKTQRVLDDSFDKGTKSLNEQERAARDLSDELDRLDQQKSKTAQQVGLAGDVGSAGRTIGGAVGALGGDVGGSIESAISALSELPDTLEALPLLKDSFSALPAITTKVTDSIGLGGFAGSLQSAIPALGGAGAAVAALALPVIAVTAVVGGLIAIFSALAKQSEEVREVTRLQFEAQQDAEKLIREGATSTEFLEARAAVERDLADAESKLAQAQEDRANAGSFAAAQEYEELIAESESTIRETTLRLGEYNELVFDSGLAANDTALAEEDLAKERAENAEALNNEIAATEQRATAAARQELALGQQIADATTDRLQAQADAQELATLEAEFAAEDQEKQEQKHRDNLDNIASAGRDNLEQLQAGFGELAKKRAESLADVDAKGNEKLSSLRNDFFESQLESTQDFQRETAKIETDTAKKRTKLLEDLNARLSDAARDNNVIAFLEAQREGNKKLADDAINAQDAEKQRVEEFARQRENERQIFLEKQAETLSGIQTEKVAIVEAFNERRIALAQQIETEKAAIEERLVQERTRFAEQEAREAEQAERARRRAEIRNRQEQRDFNERLAALRQEQDIKRQINRDELAALAALQSQIAQLQAAASRPVGASSRGRNRLGQRGASRSAGRGASGASRSSQRRPNSGSAGRAFHEGGIIDFAGSQSEGFALVKAGEIVINPDMLAKNNSAGLPLSISDSLSNNKPDVNITFSPNFSPVIGDIASVSEVENAFRANNQVLMDNLVRTIEVATA